MQSFALVNSFICCQNCFSVLRLEVKVAKNAFLDSHSKRMSNIILLGNKFNFFFAYNTAMRNNAAHVTMLSGCWLGCVVIGMLVAFISRGETDFFKK